MKRGEAAAVDAVEQDESFDTLSASLADLAGIGVRLWEETGQLRFRAPKGVMTEGRLAWLRANKLAVLEHLRRQEHGATLVADPAQRHQPFPITDIQAAYLLGRHNAFTYGGLACHGYLEVTTCMVDPSRAAAAWNALIARHDMLRAIVHPDGHQQVLEHVSLPGIRVKDLRHSDAQHVQEVLDKTRAEMSHRVYPTERWPLHELRLTQLSDRSILHLSIDLLIADLMSMQRLMLEFDRLYAEESLPELNVSFRDYVLATRTHREPGSVRAARFERDRVYWSKVLEELPNAPELPLRERVNGEAVPARFRRLRLSLDQASWASLQRRASKHGLTSSNAVLSAYAEVLGRFSRRPDFTLNLTMLGREPLHAQIGEVVGDFTAVNLLAVRRPDSRASELPFCQWARTVQDRLVEDMEHQAYSGIELLRELTRRRGAAGALMPVVYTSALGLGDSDQDSPGPFGRGEFSYGVSQTPQVWVDCQVLQHRGELVIHWDVREGVLAEGVVESMFASFGDLLTRLATAEQAWLEPAPMRLPAAQRAVRTSVQATGVARAARLLHADVLAQARRTPDAPAVITSTRVVSYAELLARAAAVARALEIQGVSRGDIVGITLERGAEQPVAVLAVLLCGAVYLPVDTTQPVLRRNELLTRAGAKAVLTAASLAEASWPEDLSILTMDLDAPLPASPSSEELQTDGDVDALAYVIYTSGSTGVPKGVMITHRAAHNTIADLHERFGICADDRVLGVAQLGFDLSVWDIFGPLSAGGALVIPNAERRSDPSHWAELVRAHGVTIWNSVPAQLQMLEEYLASESEGKLPELRLAMLSGDWIPVALPGRLQKRLPDCTLISLGGATEAAIWSIWHPIGEVPEGAVSIPYGKPLSNQTFYVLDGTLRERPDRVPGELFIGGTGVAAGYLGDAQTSASRFIEHPDTGERLYRTGDYGRYFADGSIEFLGREDLQVKIRGHRIEIAEVEAALASHPAISGAAVLVQGEALHRRLAAFARLGRFPALNGESGVRELGSSMALHDFTMRAVRAGHAAQAAAAAGEEAGRAAIAGVDVTRLLELVRTADQVSLLAMATTLHDAGLFQARAAAHAPASTTAHSFAAIAAAIGTAPQHHRLLRRWLTALTAEGWLTLDERSGEYAGLRAVAAGEIETTRQRLEALQAELDYGAELVGYLSSNLTQLSSLMRGETHPHQLLFPKAQLGTAQAAYQDNLMSRYLNRIVTAAIGTLASRKPLDRPLRILEVGAGVGGTSNTLIRALAEHQSETGVEYLFTDVSQFFLNEAKERFAAYPWVRYGIFDLNVDYRRQGLSANSFDVIVCANVLHNFKHAGSGLETLSELLTPGGCLVFIEATREIYPLLVSMEFQEGLAGFVDLRAETGQTFLSKDQWQTLLERCGAQLELCLPADGDPLALAGQHVFISRVKTEHIPTHVDEVLAHVAKRLPEYMIPASVELVDTLPMSGNGKIDRGALAAFSQARGEQTEEIGPAAEPRDDLERRLAGLFAELLNVTRVGRESDFYVLGGDSLLIAQLVGRMRDRLAEASAIDWDSLLRVVIRKPTVAAVADYLRAPEQSAGAHGATETLSPLLVLRGNGRATAPATVLVHDGSGTLAPYRRLLEQPGPEIVLGLSVSQARAYLDQAPSQLIDQLAADYARLLLAEKRESYRIVGYCMGGLLATELARQLNEAGAHVAGLTAISCFRVPYQIQDDLLLEYAFARVMGLCPSELGYPADDTSMGRAVQVILRETPGVLPAGRFAQLTGELAEVGAKFKALTERDPSERMLSISRAISSENSIPLEQVETVYRFFRHSLTAVTLHQPAPYAGDITFVRDSGTVDFMPGLRHAMQDYWSELCLGDLRIVDVPGDHFSCMAEPHVSAIAKLLWPGTS